MKYFQKFLKKYQTVSLVMAIPGLSFGAVGFFVQDSWDGNESFKDYLILGVSCTCCASMGYSFAYLTWPVLYPLLILSKI